MKFNKIFIALGVVSALSLGSCQEGKYWNEPDVKEAAFAFAKPAETVSIPADADFPSSYEVTLSRSDNGSAATVPVVFQSSSPLLSGADNVTFEAGKSEATYVINIAPGAKAGVNYTASVSLNNDDKSMIHEPAANKTYSFTISQVLVLDWQSRGNCIAVSYKWVGNADPVAIPVSEAVNWPDESVRLMRLESPYYYLEPEYAQQGADIKFFITPEGEAAGMYAAWQWIGEADDENGYYFFGTPQQYGGYFRSEDDDYVMNGVMGTAAKLTASASEVTPGWYETLEFLWEDPTKPQTEQ